MKTTIANLNQVLTFQLEGMYEVVKTLQARLPGAIKRVDDPEVKSLLRSYGESLGEQRLKLKRIFGYLLDGPYDRKAFRMAEAMAPFGDIMEKKVDPKLGDIIVLESMHATIQFLITTYVDARYIAMRMEMDPVVALLDDVVDMEEGFVQKVRSLSAKKVNEACLLVTA